MFKFINLKKLRKLVALIFFGFTAHIVVNIFLQTINVAFRSQSYKTAQKVSPLINASMLNMIILGQFKDYALLVFKMVIIKPSL